MRDLNKRKDFVNNIPCVCANCGREDNVEYHHIVPLANGGKDIITNIAPLCATCHDKAHQRIKPRQTKAGGRKPKVQYEEASLYIKQYLNCEITSQELKDKLKVGQNSDTSVKDIRSVQRYIKENNITKEQLNKASRHSAYILTGYEAFLR